MYIIINRTTNENTIIEGGWPTIYLEKLLNQGNDIIVISTYSNTIKTVVKKIEGYGEIYWEWKEYNIPENMVKTK